MSDIFYQFVKSNILVERRPELDGLASSHYPNIENKVEVWGIKTKTGFPEEFKPEGVEYIGHVYLVNVDEKDVKWFCHYHEEKTKDDKPIGIIQQALKVISDQEKVTLIPLIGISNTWFEFWQVYYNEKFSSDRSKYNAFIKKHRLEERLSVLDYQFKHEDMEMDLNI